MFIEGLGGSWDALALVAVSTIGVYTVLVLFSRLAGLRSFSEMTNFDLAATVAFGSMAATTALSSDVSLLQGAIGLAVLFVVQALVSRLRRRGRWQDVVDSRPRLLMYGGQIQHQNLAKVQMTPDDLRAKLRLSGVSQYDQVAAVILESTGEVSVLRGPSDGSAIDPDLLARVDGRELLPAQSSSQDHTQ